ncbi:MAG: DEAD/DEAH box helicase family protein [Candidatus Thermoplasmatota archaeon]
MVGVPKIDRLIQNNPYREPARYWKFNATSRTWRLTEGRREAGYMVQSGDPDDPGDYRALRLANQVRPRVKEWRAAGYPGITGVTRRLLEHWTDPNARTFPFFFCQLEAIETLVWLAEAPPSAKQGLDWETDGGDFVRECCKMATGTGKTIVMGMVIAWHVLNKVAYPQDPRFSKNILVVAPGLTVKERLQVLKHPDGIYREFSMIPGAMRDQFAQGRVVVENWHTLARREEVGPRVMRKKMGAESDEAYCRRVLVDIAKASNLLVINDEAHHAWRVDPKRKAEFKGEDKDEAQRATVWIDGLDIINKARGILKCYDFTATPFASAGKGNQENVIFEWVVSDFGLNDAIESGLVKTPRLPTVDNSIPDAETFRSRLLHIYGESEVQKDLSRKAKPEEPLPQLVRNAYELMTKDWARTRDDWAKEGHPVPPVMITVANTTFTGARIEHGFRTHDLGVEAAHDEKGLLRIDSKMLKDVEERDAGVSLALDLDDEAELTADQRAELLRRQVDSVGKPGKPGAHIFNLVSVMMLTEGWDCRTVTHIMGLRAFTSQLLCEQVIGRGLRRTSYETEQVEFPDGRKEQLFAAEYVNVFGIPFSFLPLESDETGTSKKPRPTTDIHTLDERKDLAIKWPNVLRIEHRLSHQLRLDTAKVRPFKIDPSLVSTEAQLAPLMDNRPNPDRATLIELQDLADTRYRQQAIVFRQAKSLFENMKEDWKGNPATLASQTVRLVEEFLASGKVDFGGVKFGEDDVRRRIVLALNTPRIVYALKDAITQQSSEESHIVLDATHPVGSTEDMLPWATRKKSRETKKSHVNRVVLDSAWEASDAYVIDQSKHVEAWAKNDHLGFEIAYIEMGRVASYRPDFLVRLTNGVNLVLETKGKERDADRTKWTAMDAWIAAVNQHGGFGQWEFRTSRLPGEAKEILAELAARGPVGPASAGKAQSS